MAKLMGMMNLYREELKAMARALDQEGLSQTAIAKELRIDQSTISRWLANNSRQGDLHNTFSVMRNALPKTRYLVVCEPVGKFQPPDGITFPLIIADPPWNISDPGHKREGTTAGAGTGPASRWLLTLGLTKC